MNDEKRCPRCDEVKLLDAFPRSKQTKDGRAGWCKECNKELTAFFRRTPSGIFTTLKAQAKFRKHHPFYLGRQEFIEWYEEQNKQCVYCDLPEDLVSLLQKHFRSRAQRLTIDCIDGDAGYKLGNIVLSCDRCNTIKGNMFSFEEMRAVGQEYVKPIWMRLKEETTIA